jgi:hypothetical protein
MQFAPDYNPETLTLSHPNFKIICLLSDMTATYGPRCYKSYYTQNIYTHVIDVTDSGGLVNSKEFRYGHSVGIN